MKNPEATRLGRENAGAAARRRTSRQKWKMDMQRDDLKNEGSLRKRRLNGSTPTFEIRNLRDGENI